MERETGFEPATSTLARSHSTTELFPPARPIIDTVPQRVRPHKTAIFDLSDPVVTSAGPSIVAT